jgi:hypothetical protein
MGINKFNRSVIVNDHYTHWKEFKTIMPVLCNLSLFENFTVTHFTKHRVSFKHILLRIVNLLTFYLSLLH